MLRLGRTPIVASLQPFRMAATAQSVSRRLASARKAMIHSNSQAQGPSPATWKLYWSPHSSAALRVAIALRVKGLSPAQSIMCTPNRAGADGNAYVFDDPETGEAVEYRKVNPEGRIPSLQIGDGASRRLLTQAAAILEYVDEALPSTDPLSARTASLLPEDPWARARVRQICWLIGADIHPLQNMMMLRAATRELGLPRSDSLQTHPFRRHFLTRGLAALDALLAEIFKEEGRSASENQQCCVGTTLTLADLFLVPQVRNALGADVAVEGVYPHVHAVWSHCIALPEIRETLEACGGVVQPRQQNGGSAPKRPQPKL